MSRTRALLAAAITAAALSLTTTTASAAPEVASPLAAKPPKLSESLDRLDDAARPYNVAIIGDSTGVSIHGWQAIVSKWLGRTYDRKVTLHPWNIKKPTGYNLPTWGLNNAGTNTNEITVWNGSASGTGIVYAVGNLKRLIPSGVDLIFVNLGHNEVTKTAKQRATKLFDRLAARYPTAAVVVMKQNPDIPTYEGAKQDAQVQGIVSKVAKSKKLPVVDVFGAFKKKGSILDLMDPASQIHPNADGYVIWGGLLLKLFTKNGVPNTVPQPPAQGA